jgi:hypothetical protein
MWGRWRDGGDARWGLGPDEQDGTRGVVDDEPAGPAEASRSEVGAVSVAAEDEQVGIFRGGDDLTLDPSGALQLGAGAPQAVGGNPEELPGRSGGKVLQAGAGVALRLAAAEETGEGAVGDARDVMVGDMEQDDVAALGRVDAGGIDARGPGAFDDPGDYGHGNQPPMMCRDTHSAGTARMSAVGTVSSPSRVNSPRFTSVSWSRTMRRHSRVARDPA